jgi:SecD/SecF fusion protein
MSVVLQVDLREFLRALSNNTNDGTFKEALDRASQAQKNAQDNYINLFADAWNEVKGDKKLAPIFVRNEALREEINYETEDGEIIRVLFREKANETVDLTFKLLKERIDKLGVTQPNVSLDASRDLIIVELPGIDNPERARNFLQAAAKLEFWKVFRISDAGIQQAFIEANNRLAKTMGGNDTRTISAIDTTYAVDDAGNVDSTQIASIDTTYSEGALDRGPLFESLILNSTGAQGLAVMGTAKKNQRKYIDTLLNQPNVKSLFPQDLIFRWSKDPVKDFETGEITDEYELYALRPVARW